MASRDKKDLHFTLVDAYNKAIDKYAKLYPTASQPFITCTYRSKEEQDILFTQKPKVTNARGGESPHNYLPSLAFDIAFIGINKQLDWSKENFKKFADIFLIDSKLEWGGKWANMPDAPHFQLKNWQNYLNQTK